MNGVCCNAETAANFAKDMETRIERSVKNVNREFGVFLDFVGSLNKTLFQIAALKNLEWEPLVEKGKHRRKLRNFIESLNDLTTKKSLFYSFKSKKIQDHFANSNEVCWAKLTNSDNQQFVLFALAATKFI